MPVVIVSPGGVNRVVLPPFGGRRQEGEERQKKQGKKRGREGNRKRRRKKRAEKGERREKLIYFNRLKFPPSPFGQHYQDLSIMLNELIVKLTINPEQKPEV